MIRSLILKACLVLCFLGLGAVAASAGRITSTTDVPGTVNVRERDFPSEVLAEPKPVLVFFTADWCPYCRRTAPAVQKIAESFRYRLKVVTVGYDRNPGLIRTYGVQGVPVLLMFRDGQVVARTAGEKTADELRRFVVRNLPASE